MVKTSTAIEVGKVFTLPLPPNRTCELTAFQLQTTGWIILSVFAILLSLWQSKRLRAQLSQQHTPQLSPSNKKYWGIRLASFALISIVALASYGYYLGQTHGLPKNYQWQALLWSVGFTLNLLYWIYPWQFEMGDEILSNRLLGI